MSWLLRRLLRGWMPEPHAGERCRDCMEPAAYFLGMLLEGGCIRIGCFCVDCLPPRNEGAK